MKIYVKTIGIDRNEQKLIWNCLRSDKYYELLKDNGHFVTIIDESGYPKNYIKEFFTE